MRHADIRTTLNAYGDVVTDEMAEASGKMAGLRESIITTTSWHGWRWKLLIVRGGNSNCGSKCG
jgi:hypothetical protein